WKEQRSRALKLALDRARVRFDEGAYESAINAANEVLENNPGDSAARRIKAEALVALESAQRQRELDRRAQVAIDEATRLAARDRFSDALEALAGADIAGQAAVNDARAHVEAARQEFDRLRAEAAARLEAERRAAPTPQADVPTLIATPVEPRRAFAPIGTGGFLPGPVRKRRPKPER